MKGGPWATGAAGVVYACGATIGGNMTPNRLLRVIQLEDAGKVSVCDIWNHQTIQALTTRMNMSGGTITGFRTSTPLLRLHLFTLATRRMF